MTSTRKISDMKPQEIETLLCTNEHNVLGKLSDDERVEFQRRRYGYSFFSVARLSNGRIVVANPLRDPIAVIQDWADLQAILQAAAGLHDHFRRKSAEAIERNKSLRPRSRAQQLTDQGGLADIKIDL